MFKKLFAALGGRPAGQSRQAEGSFDRLGWVAPDRNPYGIRLLDCRSLTRIWPANSENPGVASQFLRLRKSDGQEHRGKPPAPALIIECELSYPTPAKPLSDGRLYGSRFMEDKWDAYQWGDHWYFVQSWTGHLVHRVTVASGQGGYQATQVESDAGNLNNDQQLALAEADFLIKDLIYDWKGPHPMPEGFPQDDLRKIAEYSFQRYGRRASFATFEETTRLRVD